MSPLAASGQSLGVAIVVGATTFLSLVVGELVTKRTEQNAPKAIAVLVARPMRLLATLTAPLLSIPTLTTGGGPAGDAPASVGEGRR